MRDEAAMFPNNHLGDAGIPVIHSFLECEIDRLQELAANLSRNPVSAELQEKLNRYFRDTLGW